MIYLDQAATSYPKPPSVYRAVHEALTRFGANPGRGGYRMAMETSEQLYRCRESAAALFGLSDPRRVVFMPNCTTALNTVIKSVLVGGGHAVVSDLEHNAVMRPLYALSPHRPCYTVAHVGDSDEETVQAFENALLPHTRAILCTHASNVTGQCLPLANLAQLAHAHQLPLIVDAAQSAGVIPIRLEEDGVDYVCVAGHKGVFGPMGTGLLLCREDTALTPLIEGGTGSASRLLSQPAELPDRLESGTQNVSGICGLRAGLDWVRCRTEQAIAFHEIALARRMYEAMSVMRRVRLCSPPPREGRSTAVISFQIDGMPCEEAASALAKGGVAVRAGLHCAPAAHQTIGTLPDGTVRLSFGAFTTRRDVEVCIQLLKKISSNALFFVNNYDKMKYMSEV